MDYPLETYTYSYLKGPVTTPDQLDIPIHEGNCRFALQLYFYKIHGVFLKQDEIYLPGGYQKLGYFITKEQPIDWDKVQKGDVIYAQNIKKKNGELYQRNKEDYPTYADWVYDFHSAVFLDKDKIYHATSLTNGPVVWSLQKFSEYYRPISLKRVL